MGKIRNHSIEEYYHIYNRGIQKQPIFETESDYIRFLFLMLAFQGKDSIDEISREIKKQTKTGNLEIDKKMVVKIQANPLVELTAFCLMPNHFHFLLKEKVEGGISRYMQRLTTAYTKYFNIRHKKSGHLFQGPYQSVHVKDDEQLVHLSAYIHKNPKELPGWQNRETAYRWSSLTDYLLRNRFQGLLSTDIILNRYASKEEYREYLNTSTAKEN